MAAGAAREGLPGEIGARLRHLRQERGLTLKSLAQRAGISEALLSRIERGQVATTVANLASLAAGLGVGLAALLQPSPPPGRAYSLTRAGSGGAAEMTVEGYRYRPLCQDLPAPLSALLVTYGPETPEAWLTHPGTELLYLLSGRLAFQLGEEVLELAPGDCLLFDSGQPHRAWSLEPRPAETLMVVDRQAPGTHPALDGLR